MSADPVAKWLSALGTLCAVTIPENEAEKRVKAYSALLRAEYQPWAFCRSSLEYVARASKFWPAYGELCVALSAWCVENKPAIDAPRLAGPAPLSPSEYRAKKDQEDRDWWEDTLANLAERPNANYRWVRASEINLQVNQPDSHPRPWIVPLLAAILDQAVADGADTSLPVRAAVPYPAKGQAVEVAPLQRVPGFRSDMYCGGNL